MHCCSSFICNFCIVIFYDDDDDDGGNDDDDDVVFMFIDLAQFTTC